MSSTMSLIPKKKNVPNTVGIRDIVPNTEFCAYIHQEPYIPLHIVATPDEVRADHDSQEDPSAASQYRSLSSNHIPITR